MNLDEIREIFARLNRELQQANDVDSNAEDAMQEIHDRVDSLDIPEESDVEFLLGQAKEFESRFAAEHPLLERVARELVDTVAKMGV